MLVSTYASRFLCILASLPFACSRLHAEGAETALPRHCLPPEVRLCAKLELLDRLLVKLRAGGHKVGGWAPHKAPGGLAGRVGECQHTGAVCAARASHPPSLAAHRAWGTRGASP